MCPYKPFSLRSAIHCCPINSVPYPVHHGTVEVIVLCVQRWSRQTYKTVIATLAVQSLQLVSVSSQYDVSKYKTHIVLAKTKFFSIMHVVHMNVLAMNLSFNNNTLSQYYTLLVNT